MTHERASCCHARVLHSVEHEPSVVISGHPGTNIGSTDSPKVSETSELPYVAASALLCMLVAAAFSYLFAQNFLIKDSDIDYELNWD